MPTSSSYPGTYIEEIPSGMRTISGVSTSIAVFIGRTRKGPKGNPKLCLSISDFAQTFGNDSSRSELSRSVRLFFENGGTQCYILRTTAGATVPTPADYAAAYVAIDTQVDLFNLLILPKDASHDAATTASLWGPASNFCLKRRALLLMDAPSDRNASADVSVLRMDLVKDHAAIFCPRLLVNNNGTINALGPSGAIAGLMARTDNSRGVWKAPAATEAVIHGVVGLAETFSDQQNGELSSRGINTLRLIPNGIFNWGARTMDGDDSFNSEWKYIPVRRLALFIEESLYRGTQWVAFEPNDEPLWAHIRLSVRAFMHNLFRQGAFQGKSPPEAYFVKCDKETTTQNDINLGFVNIEVGFAPLKPAEFVIVKIQQMAGQIQA